MAWTTNNANDEFGAGLSLLTNPRRGNDASITLSDAGLDAASERWNAERGQGYSPHSVLAAVPGVSGYGMSEADSGRVPPGGGRLPSPDGQGAASGQSGELHLLYGAD
jgi:hypothetical protein